MKKNKKRKILIIVLIIIIGLLLTFKLKFYESHIDTTECMVLVNKPTRTVYFSIDDTCKSCKKDSATYFKRLSKKNYEKIKKGFSEGFNEPCAELESIIENNK